MGRKVGDYFHYSGAIHIHTTESDGTKSLEEVIAIGREADLDFMMFADHMGLTNRRAGGEGVYGKTLVVIGYEHNDPEDRHHYMIFGSPDVYPGTMSVAEYVAAGSADGALGIIAHPDETRPREGKHPPYPWIDWSVRGYDGIELWNQMSEWMEKLRPWNKLAMAFSPRKSMVGPTAKVLKIWDDVSRAGKLVGVVGVDAHAFPVKVGPLTVTIFPYKVHFRCLRTHIILPEPMSRDFVTARRQLYDALRNCRVFCSNMRWGVADDFRFSARNDKEYAICGGRLTSADNTRLTVRLPSVATVKLVANGETVLQTVSDTVEYAVKMPGIYRVEAWKGKRSWILSNHIRVGL
ncbi:MAG TPA: histidinol-phosphatase [Acidobacteriota bacterium]|nr:histidinol-phosphatase [Acidobacteriota bacterium]